MNRKEKIEKLNEIYSGKVLDEIKYNENYEDYEFHFSDNHYFTFRVVTTLELESRRIYCGKNNPEFEKELELRKKEKLKKSKEFELKLKYIEQLSIKDLKSLVEISLDNNENKELKNLLNDVNKCEIL